MNIDARKLSLIERLLYLQDESMLDKVEELLRKSVKKSLHKKLKPMSKEEFYARNARSQEQIRQGKLIPHEDVKKYFSRGK